MVWFTTLVLKNYYINTKPRESAVYIAMVNTGDIVTVNIITTAAAGGYSANLQIDGQNVTEEWVVGCS